MAKKTKNPAEVDAEGAAEEKTEDPIVDDLSEEEESTEGANARSKGDTKHTPGKGASAKTDKVYKPKTPKFGGVKEVGTDSWAAWLGGKPKANWTELEDPDPKTIRATQFRSTSISTESKMQHYREKGLEVKFKKDDDLLTFQQDVLDHLEKHGLDTITYIEDPSNPNIMVSCIEDHGKFNHKNGVNDSADIALVHWDEYCHASSREAVKFLTESIEPINLINTNFFYTR